MGSKIYAFLEKKISFKNKCERPSHVTKENKIGCDQSPVRGECNISILFYIDTYRYNLKTTSRSFLF